jgi:hypothetical protein
MSRVTDELVQALVARDLGCVLAFLEPGHVCRDQWGEVTDWRNASVEHVKADLRMGLRAPSDLEHTVLLCAGTNIAVPSKAQRQLMRDYLAARRVA